jgi:hypothetical protein
VSAKLIVRKRERWIPVVATPSICAVAVPPCPVEPP